MLITCHNRALHLSASPAVDQAAASAKYHHLAGEQKTKRNGSVVMENL